ncbi:MAG TPA: hypothetical protein PL048_12305 [Leptospiraceae bacterium]|nr:hypothetical protein [Leptospiraceae bacterium]HMY69854.1 hypothetical protein [Leptospiraceae bacterium]HMZ59554.1 hypothetical protein [Leptospiraceae bacterium]HNF14448.1 hypothetical protein [Leptospiraceae bacterium]HNF23429.1 hypothetical protein [Leptospiraceae bacterium]
MELVVAIEIDKKDEEEMKNLLSGLKQKTVLVNFFDRVDDYVRSAKPDLILLTIDPTLKVFAEYIRKMRQDPVTKDIPVIAILNKRDNNFTVSHKRLGFSDYLIKPLTKAALEFKIYEVLAHAKLSRGTIQEIEVIRKSKKTRIQFNANLAKHVLPKIKYVLTPPVIKAISNDSISIDIRNVPEITAGELLILDRFMKIFGDKKLAIIAGKHMGLLISESDLQEKADLFMSVEEYENFFARGLST